MKNTLKKLFPILILFALISCKEQGLFTYEEVKTGDNIYFLEKFEKKTEGKFVQTYSLGAVPLSKKDSLIQIPIRITGTTSTKDRPVRLIVADTCSMKEGVHFDFKTPPNIRANRTTDTIAIVLHRIPELDRNRVYMHFTLEKNEHFSTNILTKKNNNITQDILTYDFYFDNMLPESYLWTTFPGKQFVIDRFGPYSRRKVDLMLEVLGVDPDFFFNPKKPITPVQIMNWASYMKYWLTQEKAAGRTHLDENKKEITMGILTS